MTPSYDIVIPTSGRASLGALLAGLALGEGPLPERVIVVDDRRRPDGDLPVAGALAERLEVVAGGGAGPAAARNRGVARSRARWVAFLDDDVVPRPGWRAALERDLAGLGADVAASQGRIRVPLPRDRAPTDWERNVAGLERARWATADLACRRAALGAVGGFDERFPRAYREDADLALRLLDAGWRLVRGRREIVHPVRPADPWVSVRLQAGNADDALMARLHGRDWRARVGAPRGRRRVHVAVAGCGAVAVGAALAGSRPGASPRGASRSLAALAAAGWAAGTAELAWRRIAPGPRTPREVATMLATSAVLPAAATWHHLRGRLRARGAPPWPAPPRPAAVLLDRDGTLVHDVPYNGDPSRVEPAPGARAALARLHRAGVPTAVVSNQSGVARGLIGEADVAAVNRRVEELLGPVGPWLVCPHGPEDGCGCRKPAPGLVLEAAELLGVPPGRCAVIGDIGADVEAARAAGARAVLVPNGATRPEEIAAAPEVAGDLQAAVDLLLGGPR